MKQIVGYISGIFDLFHIGHLNILRNCKGLCDKLIVGVVVSEVVLQHKNKKPIIPLNERIDIVRNIKFVDVVIPQEIVDRYEIWKKLKFDVLFVGDDWYDKKSWNEYEKKLKKVGVKTIYFPYTKRISSTLIRKKMR